MAVRLTRSAVTRPSKSETSSAVADARALAAPPAREARTVARPPAISIPGRPAASETVSRPSPRTAARPTIPRSPEATCAVARARAGAWAGAAGTSSSAKGKAAANAGIRKRIGSVWQRAISLSLCSA